MASRMPTAKRTLRSTNRNENASATTAKPFKKDMRGMTAIRQSEAALQEENEELKAKLLKTSARVGTSKKRIQELEEQLEGIAETHQHILDEQENELTSRLNQATANHASEIGKLTEQLTETETTLQTEIDCLKQQIVTMQSKLEQAGLDSITLTPLPVGDTLATSEAETQELVETMTKQYGACRSAIQDATSSLEMMLSKYAEEMSTDIKPISG